MLEQKLEENIFENINQISSTVTTRTWVLSTECTRTWPSICNRMKKWWWFPLVCFLVDVILQGTWVLYRIKKDEGDGDEDEACSSFSKTCRQLNFSKMFKGRQIILEPFRNSKYPIRCLLWWHKILPGAIWTLAYPEPPQTSKCECFYVSS